MTCIFGVSFLIFGNLAGNALQFGIYMQAVINPQCQDNCLKRGPVIAWAISILTICAVINIATRKFSIWLNNIFAVMKVALVVVMTFLGIAFGTIHGDGCKKIAWEHKGEGGQIGDVVLALFYAMYPYTGYEQPYYVLAEVRRPKTLFANGVMYAMGTILVLYPLINTSYLCMNPYTGPQDERNHHSTNAAIDFFWNLSNINATGRGNTSEPDLRTVQGISAMLALFIFGNLIAQTYTASRVKQEIAKEGILPKSLFFAAGSDTLFARWFQSKYAGSGEQAPMAATALHWGFEVLLVLIVGLRMEPNEAYNFLTYIYTFVIVGILGFLTVAGLLYLKVDSWLSPAPQYPGERRRGRRWDEKREWWPWLDPLPCVVAVLALGFLLFGAFAKPSRTEDDGLSWWVKPVVGLCIPFLGVGWWLGLEVWQRKGGFRIVRRRVTYVDAVAGKDPVQTAELVIIKHVTAASITPFDNHL